MSIALPRTSRPGLLRPPPHLETDRRNTVTTATLSDADLRVRDAVIRQLQWDPDVDASAIGVTAKGGTVTLTGFIDTYAGKLAAERAAKQVHGVRAVANDVEVRLRLDRTDVDIAQDVTAALKLRPTLPETVQAAVHNGHVTLTGKVVGLYQRDRAERVVRHIAGVKNVHNHIDVVPSSGVRDVRRRIVGALHRDADIDARHVGVTVSGTTVTLTGIVASWTQRESAERAAAAAPGIARVDNQIVVQSFHDSKMDDWDEVC
jgi:osmotically-inducible protein OsmY